MTAFAVRALLSGLIVATVAMLARRSPAFGALVASLPLISLLGVVWLWRDTQDSVRVADHLQATFWYVLPSLPMFLLVPALLRSGAGFAPALVGGIALTILLYFVTAAALARFGVTL
ncbi:hypothetical protein ABIC65_001986 [Sphingomonas trueperi]|uniref:DUF3147 family protein n=1 Tax=Sphingomonas trueperi TaxID=53317 RepID=UPI0033920153